MSQGAARMTMLEFAEAMERGVWLLLPVGMTEDHGPHQPLGSDMLQAEHVASAVASAVEGVVASGLAYGVCRTTRNFPGTVSLSFHTCPPVSQRLREKDLSLRSLPDCSS